MLFRINKINSLIQQRLSLILSRELNLKPGIFLTVSKVDTTKDLRYARIFVSVFPESEANYAFKTLEKESGRLQKELGKKLKIKILPRLNFKIDTTEAKADEIEKILQKL
ncbi:30S ribosome-binding factor RbfA [bacterium]|nr:30S ribosome-binding factor RbfA [bacterium]